MSAQNWQAWMALLPCERCGWDPEDCPCRAGVPASAPPKQPVEPGPGRAVAPSSPWAERRTAYAPLSEVITEVVAEQRNERQEGAA